MTHTSTEQPEALRLAEYCDNFGRLTPISKELRRLHARVVELEFACEIARACTHNINTAAQSQRVPLSEKQVEDLIYAKHFRKGCAQLSYASTQVNLNWYRLGLRDGERAHGITQEKQG